MEVELSNAVCEWRDRGRSLELAGLEVFILDLGPRDSREAIVILHGFPSSSYDWRHALNYLGDGHRVVLLDFPGFGLSSKPVDYSYSLFEQADLVELVLRTLGVEVAQLVAHDMGTSVACELMARRERGLLTFRVAALVLCNGSVHIELAQLTPSQRLLRSSLGSSFARLSSQRIFKLQLKRILARPVAEPEIDDMWAQLVYRDGKQRLSQSVSYLEERTRFWHRWIGALTRLDLPVLVVWGTEDPVAVYAIAERLAAEIPGAKLVPLPGTGHYPQLEDPERLMKVILPFLETAH